VDAEIHATKEVAFGTARTRGVFDGKRGSVRSVLSGVVTSRPDRHRQGDLVIGKP
jgi:hypothetical protein